MVRLVKEVGEYGAEGGSVGNGQPAASAGECEGGGDAPPAPPQRLAIDSIPRNCPFSTTGRCRTLCRVISVIASMTAVCGVTVLTFPMRVMISLVGVVSDRRPSMATLVR